MARITFSVTDQEHKGIKEAASNEGLTPGQYAKRSTFINFKTAKETKNNKEMYAEEAGISSAYDISKYLSDIQYADKEHFVCLTMDSQNNIIQKHIIGIGTANKCLVHQRDVFRAAVTDNAVSIIIAHNHPGGSLNASTQDIELERVIKECSVIMGINLLDSIIVSKKGFSSAVSEGRI